jgi:hypothetical protein
MTASKKGVKEDVFGEADKRIADLKGSGQDVF